jgi:glutamine phosphoribosylpyrophosphate amidotransferase
MNLTIAKDRASSLSGEIRYSSNQIKNNIFNRTFIEKLQKELGTSVDWKVFDDSDTVMREEDPAGWRRGKIVIDLAN